ncbi:MAG TPA: tetratricopeptide repeat protein [Terriglobales bacterium]|nr:tetratricopeptide repeat protein [Terriglobales bacterium]
MRKATILAFVFLAGFLPRMLHSGDNRPFDRAQRALKVGDYKDAIAICLGLLESSPADYDVNFLLAQAYARSGDRDKAMSQLTKMDALFPRNSDVVLFLARVYTGKGELAKAQARYKEVLEFAPGNEEALVGTADVAARRRDFAAARETLRRVLEKNPQNADAYYHLGLVEQWQGNRGRAREDFEKAVALEPANEDYRVFLTAAAPRLQRKFELRYGHEVEDWSGGRPDFQNDRLALSLGLPRNAGALIIKYNQTRRFGETDHQFGIEAYPRLWTKAYGRFELGYATPASAYPRWTYLAEVYQGFFTAAEASLGVWRLTFPGRSVTVGLGSIGYYLGSYYPCVRFNYCSDQGNHSFSWVASARRYFSAENYVYLGYGQGTHLLEDLTLQDLLPTRGDIFLAGAVWYVLRSARVEAHVSRIAEAALKRTTFQLTLGYRWR